MTIQFPAPHQALGADEVIESDAPEVIALVDEMRSRLATARQVSPDDVEPAELVGALFRWVRDEVEFDMAPDVADRSSWRATRTLERRWGFCQQKAVLLAALCRAAGVPAVLVFQSVIDRRMPDSFESFLPDKRMDPHGLAAVHLDGVWQRLDPSLHRGMCERAGLRLVEWEPGRDAVLPASDLSGGPHCSIETEHGAWLTMPQEIIDQTLGLPFLSDPSFLAQAARHGERRTGSADS